MNKLLLTFFVIFLLCQSLLAAPFGIKGVYISAETMGDARKLQRIIDKSKGVGISLFVVDLYGTNATYKKNLELIKEAQIPFIVRIVVFPDGAEAGQITQGKRWEEKLSLVHTAASIGAKAVQLDYIRYTHKVRPSQQNALDVFSVIKAFKSCADEVQLPLQIAVFGISSFRPILTIGQNLPLFAPSVNVICPMLYPSHFDPYIPHSERPYQTVADSLKALKRQFNHQLSFKLLPYIETYNYRYPLGPAQRKKYIAAQIQATIDQGTHGFIAWSANNLYDYLFEVLGNQAQYFPQSSAATD